MKHMHYHIVGIAGAGMSAIANILLDQGHHVSGSDLQANASTAALVARGATVYVGHHPAYVSGAAAVVATAAVRSDHPEVAAARVAGIPLLTRAELWRDWSQKRRVIAIAGTHGKTTTTAMIALLLTQAGMHPGFLIGSDAPDLGTNARWGDPSAPLVIEADEYARAFLALTPAIAVLTNVEWDHPDVYPAEADYVAVFDQFVGQVQQTLLVCGDSGAGIQRLTVAKRPASWLTYGLEASNHYHATPLDSGVWAVNGRHLSLAVPGQHNMRNALAALGVADQLGIPAEVALTALHSFRGTARRFEHKGDVAGVTVIDDYAHHPTEVRATLEAARSLYGERRIVVYLQPHTYSRTQALLEQWPGVFAAADLVLVGAIYGARETESGNATPFDLAQELTGRITALAALQGRPAYVYYAGGLQEAIVVAQSVVRPGDVFLTLGAGDGYRVGEELLAYLKA